MFDYKQNLKDNKTQRVATREMARKLFLSYPTSVFLEKPEIEYQIRDRTARMYGVPISAIQVTGSAKAGFSLIKGKDFDPRHSDLDLAIIDTKLFATCWEEAHLISNGFSADKFNDPIDDKGATVVGGGRARFLKYVQRGIINPEFLPSGPLRARIISNATRISKDFLEHFGKVTTFFYASEFFFQTKQEEAIHTHWEKF